MNQTNCETYEDLHQKRMKEIGNALWEMRFAEGKNQDEYTEYGVSRRQIQRGEYSSNLTLKNLFNLIDCYGYSLHEFFEHIE